jgi:trk system potassium uptake protein TrkA
MRIFIAGGGQVAAFIARRLIREANELTILEHDEGRCRYLDAHLDAKIVHGNAASIADWRKAGITKAEMVIAVTQSDELNLLAALIVQAQAPAAFKAVRLRTHEFSIWRQMLEAQGVKIDRVIHPESDIVARILRVLAIPGVSDIRDFAGGAVKLFGMNVEPSSWLAGKTLAELDRAGPPRNAIVGIIFRGYQVIIPHGGEVLQAGDHIYTVTTRGDLDDFLRFMGIEKQESLKRVFIVGGGEIGIAVAEVLEREGVSIKLFEDDGRQCEHASSVLKKTIVIHGDGTDQETLLQENVEGVDAFMALTKDDDANIIVSLLARRLGAKKLVALVNRLDYLPLAQRLGINTTVSLRLKAMDAILEFVRKGGVLSVRTFREQEAEAIELIAPKTSRYIGLPLRDVPFPRGVIVGAIARPDGEVLVPRGDAIIEAGDRVVFLSLDRCVPELESAFLSGANKALWGRR